MEKWENRDNCKDWGDWEEWDPAAGSFLVDDTTAPSPGVKWAFPNVDDHLRAHELHETLHVLHTYGMRIVDVSEDGEVFVMPDSGEGLQTQFEALSKDLDAEELSALVRTKLGLDVPVSRSKL